MKNRTKAVPDHGKGVSGTRTILYRILVKHSHLSREGKGRDH